MTRREEIWSALQSKEYRDAYSSEHIDQGVAFQLRYMRGRESLRQKDVARLAGMTAAQISLLENPDNDRKNLVHLKRLAAAFDVALVVRFVPFSELADYTANITEADMGPKSFTDENRT